MTKHQAHSFKKRGRSSTNATQDHVSHTTCHTVGGRSKSIPKTEESVTDANALRYLKDAICDSEIKVLDIYEDACLKQKK